jgi:hypothetical protein
VKNELSFPEKTPPGAFLKAARESGKEAKESKGKKKKRRIRQQKEEAACRGR